MRDRDGTGWDLDRALSSCSIAGTAAAGPCVVPEIRKFGSSLSSTVLNFMCDGEIATFFVS